MSTVVKADAAGTIQVPSALLPDGTPFAVYRVEKRKGALVVLREKGENGEKPFWETATPEEQAEAFRAWATKPRPAVGLSDHAVSRDSMYE